MYSGLRRLGEQQDEGQDVDEGGGDIDFISTNFMSPDSGYPPQRIEQYDTEMAQHQTLNGVGQSRMAAPWLQNFLTRALSTRMRTQTGTPASSRGAMMLRPRFSTLLAKR